MLARRPAVSFAHKEKLSYEQRCYESTRVREKYSDRFPVIVERDSNSDVPAIDKCAQPPRTQDATHTLATRCMHVLQTRAGRTLPTRPDAIRRLSTLTRSRIHRCKYLIPHDMTMGQLVYVLRKRISVPAEQAIFVFVGNTLPPASALVSNVVCCRF